MTFYNRERELELLNLLDGRRPISPSDIGLDLLLTHRIKCETFYYLLEWFGKPPRAQRKNNDPPRSPRSLR